VTSKELHAHFMTSISKNTNTKKVFYVRRLLLFSSGSGQT